MANRIVSVHAGIYGMGIYAIMLPSRGFSVAYYITMILLITHTGTTSKDGLLVPYFIAVTLPGA